MARQSVQAAEAAGQAAGLRTCVEDRDVVTGAAEVLRARQARRAGADDREVVDFVQAVGPSITVPE